MNRDKILREIFTLNLECQKKVSHQYAIAHYLTRICFGLFGMIDSLKKLHLGNMVGYFDYNLYFTHMFSFSIIYDHALCTSELKVKLENLNKSFHQADDILKRRGTLGGRNTLEDTPYLKEITSEAIDSLSSVYLVSLQILLSEIKEYRIPITLESLYEPDEKEKELMLSFIQRISKELLTP